MTTAHVQTMSKKGGVQQGATDVVALIDMDCFYVQVKQKNSPETRGLPCAVAQYTGGGLLASNYVARKYGIGKSMRLDSALKLCPDLVLFYVKEKDGKADLQEFRDASNAVFDVIKTFTDHFERASIDESFICLNTIIKSHINSIDRVNLIRNTVLESAILSNNTINVNSLYKLVEHNIDALKLVIGAHITNCIRKAIFDKTGFTCSAGIARNKTLAKLVSNMNKPEKQTLLLDDYVSTLLSQTDIKSIRNLGGKFGQQLKEDFNVKYVGQLASLSINQLCDKYGPKTGKWVYNISRGISNEEVTVRHMPLSIGCSKRLENKETTILLVREQLKHFSEELYVRLSADMKMYKRYPTAFIVGITTRKGERRSRTVNFGRTVGNIMLSQCVIANMAFKTLLKLNRSTNNLAWYPPISVISLSFNKFEHLNNSLTFKSNTEADFFIKRTNDPATLYTSIVDDKCQSMTNLEENPPSEITEGSRLFTKCDKCALVIRYDEIFQHEDYHTALDLQAQFDKKRKHATNINQYFKRINKR